MHSRLPAGHWPLLALLVAQYCAPDIDTTCAASVAIAIECFICALDLLDDVEDDDQTPTLQALGVARTLNVSTTLLMLAQQALLSLSEQHVPSSRILHLLDTLQEAALVATAGQHRDLLAEHRPVESFTQEECIEIAAGKAGSLMRLACSMGAICAGAGDMTCAQFAKLGELLGISYQLDNDAHDLYYLLQGHPFISTNTGTAQRGIKTDLVRGKKTLPLVIAAQREVTLQTAALQADEIREEQLRALHEGITATWGISLLYRERARECLQEIEAERPITPSLRMLLDL